MKASTFSEMLAEYGEGEIFPEDIEEREKQLHVNRYSVIFEGDLLETESAKAWLNDELQIAKADYIFYGKVGYDYGFFEFFFAEELQATNFKNILPSIFTMFPNGKNIRTNGYNNYISQAL